MNYINGKKWFVLLFGAFILTTNYTANASSCIDQVPAINSATPSVTTSGDYSSIYPGWKVFDDNYASMWISEIGGNPAWIAYEFDDFTYIDRYSIDYANGSITTRAPKDWELQGLDGDFWVTLDNRVNEVNWAGFEKRSYAVSNPGYYKKYRLYITDDNDDRSGIVVISIGELALELCSCYDSPCNYSSEQVPTLTGDSSAVTTSGVYSSRYKAWKAFDSSNASMWISAVSQTPAWIGYEWNTPRFIDQYSIQYSNGSITTRAPKDWSLQGWNGNEWVTIDSRFNQTGWSGSEMRHYTVMTPGSYTKYRLYITDDNDDRLGIVVISMGTLSLRGCEP